MNLFGDMFFFLCLAVLSVPAVVLGVREKNGKRYGFAVTLLMVFLLVRDDPKELCSLIAYCVWQLGLVSVYLRIRRAGGRQKGWFRLAVLLALAPLLVYKVSLLSGTAVLDFVGISYMTFKVVQIVIEIYDGLIETCDPRDMLYLLTFFPCIASGPIDRSRRFETDLRETRSREAYLDLLGRGLFKLCLGITYRFVFGAAFYQAMVYLGGAAHWWSNLIYMYAYGFYLFFDFAGHGLMAVGTSYIFGIETPDNFRRPFLSVDIKDFWDRWHITLSHWFRDFVFTRFLMMSMRGRWFRSKLTGASAAFLVNMLLMGAWHGLDASYLLYGAYHGVLLSLTEIYQKKSAFYKKHRKERAYRLVSGFVTFQLVMFGFFIFSGRFLEIL